MHDVTTNAPGARTFQVKQGKGVATVELIPGATRTLDLVDINHPVLKAWADSKEVTFTEVSKSKPPSATVKKQDDNRFSVVCGDKVLAKDLADEAAANAWIADAEKA